MQGFVTTIAEDGEPALRIAEKCAFDLMLLDLGLPKVDGWTVLRELRSRSNVKPIIITARLADREKSVALHEVQLILLQNRLASMICYIASKATLKIPCPNLCQEHIQEHTQEHIHQLPREV